MGVDNTPRAKNVKSNNAIGNGRKRFPMLAVNPYESGDWFCGAWTSL